jgi:Fic family protein
MVGRLRDENVHLNQAGSPLTLPVWQPPPVAEVRGLLAELCRRWREEFPNLTAEENDIQAIARFHYEFLKIHPFLDGNGRTARALLLQQCLDLFGRANLSRLDRGASYNSALIAANGGDLVPLIDVIRPVLEE